MRRKRGTKVKAFFLAGVLTIAGCLTCFAEYTDQETVVAVQQALNEAGYDCGTPDGKIGNMTRSAISAYQEASGLTVTGTIEDELLENLHLASTDTAEAQGDETSAQIALDNAEAWNALYTFIAENGQAVDGMTALTKDTQNQSGSTDVQRRTDIGIREGETDRIYFYTYSDYSSGETGGVSTGLTIGVRENEGIAEWVADTNTELRFNGVDTYVRDHVYGHTDLTVLTPAAELIGERSSSEVKDINGNESTSDQATSDSMGTRTKSLGELLEDGAAILAESGADVTMADLGFLSLEENATEDTAEETGNAAPDENGNESFADAAQDLEAALSGEETAEEPAEQSASAPGTVPAAVSQTDTTAEITYNEPVVILDDELVTISIEGVKYDGEKAWYYYSIKNNSADTYVNEFFQSEAFGDYMFNYSSYTPEGSSGAVPPGKNSGRRGKGAVSAHVNSLADLQTFSGAVKIYPSDNPDSYSSEGSYSASFSITADLGEYEGTQEQAESAPEGIEVNETDEYAEIIYHTPAVLVDDENVTVTLDSVKLVFGDRVWFYYSLLNKGERYVNEFFDGVSFGDYMVDFSSYTSEGSGDSVPAGKNSGSRGKGSTDITNVSSLEDLKNFSGSVKLYFGDEPGSYSSDGSYSVSFEVHYDALAGSDAQAAEAQTETAQAAEVQSETEAAAGDEAMITEDEIRQLLVGIWSLGEGGSVDFTEEAAKITLNGHPLDGTYAINTEEKQIDVTFTVESKNVTIHLPYTCADGVFTLYNNRGGEIGTVSMDTPAATEQAATEQAQAAGEQAATEQAEENGTDAGAQQSSGISAEELEAQLREQPVYVDSVEVLDSGDGRFYDYNMGYRNCNFVLPHIVNQSEDDIKDLQIWTFGWDNNNLPVTVEYNGTKTNDVMFSEVSLIPGGVTNQYDAEMLNCVPTDYECKKAKCLVAGYRTYSGETWTNPLATDWVKCYKDQKLVEPVYYTDAETVQKVQTALNEAGYDCGTPDGIAGSKTYEALHQYQEANGLTVQDHITDALLQSMGIQ